MSDDRVVRAITDDGAFRVITARTTDTVRGTAAHQRPTGQTTGLFANLLTSSILYRETMAPQLRVQMLLSGAGGNGRLVADSSPIGANRGLVQVKGEGEGELDLGPGAQLQVMRSLPGGKLHQGIVAVPPSGSIVEAFMAYMQQSEQVTSMIAISTSHDDGVINSSGGYMVQLLPEASRGLTLIMSERLEQFRQIDELVADPGFTADGLMAELLHGMDHTRLEESSVRFGCWCTETAIMNALATLPRADIEEMISDGELLEISCDYCEHDYRIAPERLRGLTTSN